MSFIQKARIFTLKQQVLHDINKTIKQQAYRTFIQNPDRTLPSYRLLATARDLFYLIGFGLLVEPAVQCVFYLPSCFCTGNELPLYVWFATASLSIILFGITVDYVILCRWTIEYTWFFKQMQRYDENEPIKKDSDKQR